MSDLPVVELPADTADDVLDILNEGNTSVHYVRKQPDSTDVVKATDTVKDDVPDVTAPVAPAVSDTVEVPKPVTPPPTATEAVFASDTSDVPVPAEAATFASATADVNKAVDVVAQDSTRVVTDVDSAVDSDSTALLAEIHRLTAETHANIAKVAAFLDEFSQKAAGSPIGKMLGI